MAGEVRRCALSREAYEERITEVKDLNTTLKRQVAALLTEQRGDTSAKLHYTAELESSLAQAREQAAQLRSENEELLYLERLSVECKGLEPRLREVELREKQQDRLREDLKEALLEAARLQEEIVVKNKLTTTIKELEQMIET